MFGAAELQFNVAEVHTELVLEDAVQGEVVPAFEY
jgi:hypothetical protein